ncbi:Ger(x)C family spore germination protein [Oceanobacillus chungangensis]|uniref:Ger(x)C family spore germination protein n=1 Tax=Oceanobacillus chungangensis TaxID=1229152 RepID=UPI0014735339|nr:Ger(x)C family spore germination protein [Oceanobacillus chungangensis]
MSSKRWLLIFLITPIFLAGCWGKIEIENRGFVIGTAIDLEGKQGNEKYNLLMTNQLINPAAISKQSSGGGGGGNQKGFINIQDKSDSLFAASRKMRHLTNLIPYYQHLKVILVSEEVIKEPGLFSDVMDVFVRNHELRRGVKVFVTEGEANKILDFVPQIEKTPAMFIEKLTTNSKNAGILEPKRVDRLQNIFIYERSYFIPRVKLVNNEIVYDDAVIVSGENNQMIGTLNSEETKGLLYILGGTKGGSIETKFDDNLVNVETQSAKVKTKLTNKDKENFTFSLNINFEGTIEEHFGTKDLLKEKSITEIEKDLEKDIKQLVERTIKKVQREYKADVIGLGDVIREKHYDLWKNIVYNWDRGENYFSKSTVEVNVKANISSTGAANRIKQKGKRGE